jgi:hypothetical protein
MNTLRVANWGREVCSAISEQETHDGLYFTAAS